MHEMNQTEQCLIYTGTDKKYQTHPLVITMKYSYRWYDTISVAFKTQTEINFHHLGEW